MQATFYILYDSHTHFCLYIQPKRNDILPEQKERIHRNICICDGHEWESIQDADHAQQIVYGNINKK